MWQINGQSFELNKTSSSLRYKLVLRISSQCLTFIQSTIEQYFPFFPSNSLPTLTPSSCLVVPLSLYANTTTHSTLRMCNSVDLTGVSPCRKNTAFGKRSFLMQTSKGPVSIMKSSPLKESIQCNLPSPPEVYMPKMPISPLSSSSPPEEKNWKVDLHVNSWKRD